MSSVDQLFHDAFALSPEIKSKLIHELWDDLAANPADVPVHDWQIEELERRKQKLSEVLQDTMEREGSTLCATFAGNNVSAGRPEAAQVATFFRLHSLVAHALFRNIDSHGSIGDAIQKNGHPFSAGLRTGGQPLGLHVLERCFHGREDYV